MPDPTAPSPARSRPGLRPLLIALPALTLLTGVLYPLALAAVARVAFPHQAGGSLVERGGAVVGSGVVGQNFAGAGYFRPRPSACGYDGAASGASHLGPNDSKLRAEVAAAVAEYRRANELPPVAPVPADAVTRSGSGLDPHISPADAELQAGRVARARSLDEALVRRHALAHTSGPQLGFLGESRVNVLALNLALDAGLEPGPAPLGLLLGGWAGRRWVEYAAFLAVVLGAAWPVGGTLARLFSGAPTGVERGLLRLLGVRPGSEMTAGEYAAAFVLFGLGGGALVFALLLVQGALPGGPDGQYLTTSMTPDLALNTAVSFSTGTTWQAYSGESTLRYWAQLAGLTAQGFAAGGAGLAVAAAFARGFARRSSPAVGDFWVDLVRATVRVLLPAAFALGLVLVWQGVPMNFAPYAEVVTVEGRTQVIAQGPVAALEAIKNLGTNGGGFFGANGAHPAANPTPLSNFLGLLAIAVIPASLPVMFGRLAGRPRAGWLLLAVMAALFAAGLVVCDFAESADPAYAAGRGVVGGNLEGKETRFGVGGSVLAAVVTSNGATGSNNSMHGSFHPLGVLVMLGNMLLGEIVFGGLGSGLYGMVVVALVAAFLGGLMVGRSPEYLGKSVGVTEAKLVAAFVLVHPATILLLAALASATDAGRAGPTGEGPRAFSELAFAYASCAANNGTAMGGLGANTPFYNLTTTAAMLLGRFAPAVLAILLAGRFAAQRQRESAGGLSGEDGAFALLVLASAVLVGAICFLPALALGPLAESLGSAPH